MSGIFSVTTSLTFFVFPDVNSLSSLHLIFESGNATELTKAKLIINSMIRNIQTL